jgi:ASTRA-associated protein 1
MDTITPADVQLGLGTSWRKPWLLNSLEVNALNFCAFAASPSAVNHAGLTTPSIFVVFPSNMDSESVDIWKLPEQQRVYAAIRARDTQTGMAMSLRLFWLDDRNLALAAGYESGHVCLYVRDTSQEVAEWKMWFARKEHSQPGNITICLLRCCTDEHSAIY